MFFFYFVLDFELILTDFDCFVPAFDVSFDDWLVWHCNHRHRCSHYNMVALAIEHFVRLMWNLMVLAVKHLRVHCHRSSVFVVAVTNGRGAVTRSNRVTVYHRLDRCRPLQCYRLNDYFVAYDFVSGLILALQCLKIGRAVVEDRWVSRYLPMAYQAHLGFFDAVTIVSNDVSAAGLTAQALPCNCDLHALDSVEFRVVMRLSWWISMNVLYDSENGFAWTLMRMCSMMNLWLTPCWLDGVVSNRGYVAVNYRFVEFVLLMLYRRKLWSCLLL